MGLVSARKGYSVVRLTKIILCDIPDMSQWRRCKIWYGAKIHCKISLVAKVHMLSPDENKLNSVGLNPVIWSTVCERCSVSCFCCRYAWHGPEVQPCPHHWLWGRCWHKNYAAYRQLASSVKTELQLHDVTLVPERDSACVGSQQLLLDTRTGLLLFCLGVQVLLPPPPVHGSNLTTSYVAQKHQYPATRRLHSVNQEDRHCCWNLKTGATCADNLSPHIHSPITLPDHLLHKLLYCLLPLLSSFSHSYMPLNDAAISHKPSPLCTVDHLTDPHKT
jgi:hypothetical protein